MADPTRSRRAGENRSAATRASILQAALELADEAGWGRLTARLVASRAHVSLSQVNYHFDSVSALRLEAVASVLDARLKTLAAAVDDPADATEVFELLGRLATAGNAQSLVEAMAAAGRDPAARDRVRGSRRWLEDRLRRRLEQASGRGELRPDLNPRNAAVLILCALDGFLVRETLDLDPDIELLAEAFQILLRA